MISKSKATESPPRQIRAAIYCRKSVSDKYEKNVTSLEAQRDAGASYIRSKRTLGWTVVPTEYHDDGCTGANMNRPAFRQLVADIEAGCIDAVVIHRFDRLSRSQKDFLWIIDFFEKHGVQFVSVNETIDTSTGVGECMLTMLIAFAQLERRTIAERTAQKIRAARERGHWTGGARVLGYDLIDTKLVVNQKEAAIVKRAFERFVETKRILTTAQSLNDEGHRTHKGRKFDRGFVRRLLRRPLYGGLVQAGDKVVPGQHEAIVSRETWDRAQELLDDAKRPERAKKPSGRLLARLLHCGRCGSPMRATATKKGATAYGYYVCLNVATRGATACPGSRVNAADVERLVFDEVRKIGQNPELVAETAKAVQSEKDVRLGDLRQDLARLEKKRTALLRQRTKLVEEASGDGPGARPLRETIGEIAIKEDEVDAKIAAATGEIQALQGSEPQGDEIREALRAFGPVWHELFPPERVRIAELLIERVEYDPDGDGVEIELRREAVAVLGAAT